MAVNRKNLSEFLSIMQEDVDEYCARMKKETDAAIEAELERTKNEAMTEFRELEEEEAHKLNEKNNSGLSVKGALQLRELLAHREKIAGEVFDKARKRIVSFTKSSEYAEFLKESAAQITEVLGRDCTLYIRKEDSAYIPELEKTAAHVQVDDDIILGGLKGKNTSDGVTADDTLDERFREQKNSFFEKSGLSVTL